MSIYLARKELIDILRKSNLQFRMENDVLRPVAEIIYKNNKRKFLDFDNYSEENVKELVDDEKRVVYMDLEFWNYNYCKKDNISKESIEQFIENLDVIVESSTSFSEGTITVLILLHELLLNVYKIEKLDVFSTYLDTLKINRKIIKNFLINMEYTLPLTKNYNKLIETVFDDETVFQFLFNKGNDFSIGEFKTILKNFKIENIHLVSFYIYNRVSDSKKCLKYICVLLELYEGDIDMNKIVYYDKESHLGYYLLNLDINSGNEMCYYTVMRKYISKNGSIDIRINKDKELTDKLKIRRIEIENYFYRV